MSQLRYWVWLASVDGVRTISLCRVLEHFGGAMEAYFAPEERLSELEDLSPQERRALSDRRLERTEQILALCQEKNIRILTLHDAAYPDRLRQIADPPLVLYVRGNLPFLDELPTIAIVGTRKGERLRDQCGDPPWAGDYFLRRLRCYRHGARRGRRCCPGRAARGQAVRRCAGYGDRRQLSRGQFTAYRRCSICRGCHQRISSALSDEAGELSPPQPHYQRPFLRRVHRGSVGAQRRAHHRQSCAGAGARCVRRSG